MASHEPAHQPTVMEMVERAVIHRSNGEGLAFKALGAGLLVFAILLALAGPDYLSRSTLAAVHLVVIFSGAAYGIALSIHQRQTQVSRERAYSAHLEELSQRLRNMAYRDAVTGLYNHRYFREQLQHEVERSVRYGQHMSLVLMDMNGFKEINDRYGHFMGDRFLGMVGEVIERQIRASDVGARYGGDEFVILLPATARDEAESTAQKLAAAVSACAAMTASGESVQLGLSFGVATCPNDARSANELIESADARLYEAKARRKKPRRSAHDAA